MLSPTDVVYLLRNSGSWSAFGKAIATQLQTACQQGALGAVGPDGAFLSPLIKDVAETLAENGGGFTPQQMVEVMVQRQRDNPNPASTGRPRQRRSQADSDNVFLGLAPATANAIAAAGLEVFTGRSNRPVRILNMFLGSDSAFNLSITNLSIGDQNILTGAQAIAGSAFSPDVQCCPATGVCLDANVPMVVNVTNLDAVNPHTANWTIVCEPLSGPAGRCN